jgi:hypothetical protein
MCFYHLAARTAGPFLHLHIHTHTHTHREGHTTPSGGPSMEKEAREGTERGSTKVGKVNGWPAVRREEESVGVCSFLLEHTHIVCAPLNINLRGGGLLFAIDSLFCCLTFTYSRDHQCSVQAPQWPGQVSGWEACLIGQGGGLQRHHLPPLLPLVPSSRTSIRALLKGSQHTHTIPPTPLPAPQVSLLFDIIHILSFRLTHSSVFPSFHTPKRKPRAFSMTPQGKVMKVAGQMRLESLRKGATHTHTHTPTPTPPYAPPHGHRY